jgi:SPP1 gp7 family putative phage head morphogenesis protein
LLELGAKSKKKAEQIAIDQTNKITENMNNQRVQSLGATKFEWMTTGKRTVRDEHDSFDGKIYTYKDGAGARGIVPGQDVNCQCTAIPIFEENE